MKYLDTPCPRPDCGQKKLNPPKASGKFSYCFCDGCHRKVQYLIREHIDGTKGYELVIVGAKNNDMVRATFWIRRSQKQALKNRAVIITQDSMVRDALDSAGIK